MINSEELIGTTEYPTPQKRCPIKRYRYNRVQLYLVEWNRIQKANEPLAMTGSNDDCKPRYLHRLITQPHV
jgi:hypothetical protein